jgi:very-short-patch-repair endonuclease
MRHPYDAGSAPLRIDEKLARLAARQHGVFSRTQAERLGATRGVISYRLRVGRWNQLSRDVFRLAGAPSSWRQDLMAACLAWGDGAVVSHRAAAALWQFLGFEPGIVELTVPEMRKRRAPGIIHRHRLHSRDATKIDGISVTTPARTLIDLAAIVPEEELEETIDDLVVQGIVSVSTLRRRLAHVGRTGLKGTAMMRRLLDARDPSADVPRNVFERRLLRTLRRHGLPSPLLQYAIRDEAGLIGVVDFAYPDHHLVIEADGRRWHTGRVRWEHDRKRRNRLTLLGWRVIHVTWTELATRPTAVAASVRRALGQQPART